MFEYIIKVVVKPVFLYKLYKLPKCQKVYGIFEKLILRIQVTCTNWYFVY